LAVAGKDSKGCNITKITSRSREEWIDLLGKNHEGLLNFLTDGKDTLDQAGNRIWAILETVRKLSGDESKKLDIIRQIDNAVLICTEEEQGKTFILSFPLRFTRGRERILAFVVQKKQIIERSDLLLEYDEYKELFRTPAFDVIKNGPQGQEIFVQRLPVTFKHNSQLSRTVYFSNYFYWVGDVRDCSAWPGLKGIAQQFSTGNWGMVTNNTKIKILGEATVHDQVEIRLWTSGNGGPANSTMELTYDFLKIMGNDQFERLAWCEQTTTWVEIFDHGAVKPAPYPDFYWNVMKEMLPKYDAPNVPIPMPEPLADLKKYEGNEVHYQAPSALVIRPLLYEQIIETSLENSNLVGNIYFANYYAWQGRVRDQYFYNLIPDYFRGIGEKGELLCLECWVDHMREAMPFDRIVVTMALKTWQTCSAVFRFEYIRLDPDGKRVKLAYGEHEAIWVTRNKEGKPLPNPFPKPVEDAFRQAISIGLE